MKQLPHVASLLYGQPWAILATAHAELGGLYHNYVTGNLKIPENLAERGSACHGISYQVDHNSGIAIVSLDGVIAKRAPEMLCGPPVIELIKLDELLDEISADTLIQTTIFHFNSPGGMVIGLQETSDRLRDLSAEGMRTIAYCDFMMCSAAYYLAAACDEIYCAPSAAVGSIGTYIAGLDSSRAFEMEGLELILAKSGNLKAMGHPGKVWSPEEKEHLQAQADAVGLEFRQWVVKRRGGMPEEAMQGQWFFAKDAAPQMHDGLHNRLPDLLAALMEKSTI